MNPPPIGSRIFGRTNTTNSVISPHTMSSCRMQRPEPRGRFVAAADGDALRLRLARRGLLRLLAVLLVGGLDPVGQRVLVVGPVRQVDREPPALAQLELAGEVGVRVADLALGAVGAEQGNGLQLPGVLQFGELRVRDLAVVALEREERERDHGEDDERDPPAGEQRVGALGRGLLRSAGGRGGGRVVVRIGHDMSSGADMRVPRGAAMRLARARMMHGACRYCTDDSAPM